MYKMSEKIAINIIKNMVTDRAGNLRCKECSCGKTAKCVRNKKSCLEIACKTILDSYNNLKQEVELNKETVYLANNTICNYDMGYQDGLNKIMTATEIVAERRKFMILGEKIKQLENVNYELHKKIDEGNKKVARDYISRNKIKEKSNRIKTDENYPKFADYKWSDTEEKLFWEADVLEELLED